MAQKWGDWYRRFGLRSLLVVGGAIARVVVLSPIATLGDCALAQITPDGTLGAESSVVTPPTLMDFLLNRLMVGGRGELTSSTALNSFLYPLGAQPTSTMPWIFRTLLAG